jgi:hypothetical protein
MIKNQVNIESVKGNLYLTDSSEQKVDSVVNSLLTEISLIPVDVLSTKKRSVPAAVIVKVDHNNLQSQCFILKQYQAYSASIETSYKIIDTNIINGKSKVFLMLDNLYVKALSDIGIKPFASEIDMELIRQNADDIIKKIITGLKDFCYESSNVPSDKESVEIGVNVVVAHAFVECLILENPNDTI